MVNITFKPTTHEPNVYSLSKDVFGEEFFLPQQVDAFALGCTPEDIAEQVCKLIRKHISAPLKREVLITRFNVIDVDRTHFS